MKIKVNDKEVNVDMKENEVTGIDVWKINKEEVIPILERLDPTIEWFFDYCAKVRHLTLSSWKDAGRIDVQKVLKVIENCRETCWRKKKLEKIVEISFDDWLASLKKDGWLVLKPNEEVYISKKVSRKSVKLSVFDGIVTWLRIEKVNWKEALWLVKEYAPLFDSELFSLAWGELKFGIGIKYDHFPLEELAGDLLLIDVWG